MRLSRRNFLASLLFASSCAGSGCTGSGRTGSGDQDPDEPSELLVDFHVHLFGVGDEGTGCFLSERQRTFASTGMSPDYYPLLLRLLGLKENGQIDRDYVSVLVGQLGESSIEKAVLVGQDGRYDEDGILDRAATNFYVPNDYLLKVSREHSDLFVPCVSINPKRRDVFEELERCAEEGARVVKIHPPSQDVDPGLDRFRPFYRRVAELDILLMVHTGAEHGTPIVGDDFSDPVRLVPALEEGCTVIAAHAGMGTFLDGVDFFPALVDLLPRYPRLYCDSAVLASTIYWRSLPRILEQDLVLERLIHGSDFPFPSNALAFWNRLNPLDLLRLSSETNLLERDLGLKQALGLPVGVFERGGRLLG